jgi:hypothetical protein
MTIAEKYKMQAAQLRSKARKEASLSVKTELESLARCYIALSEQCERNARTSVGSGPSQASRS